MVALTIIVFFVGMTLLAFTVIVVESVWLVALVGVVHITASVVLGVLIVRRLGDEERGTADEEEADAAPSG
ncbi:MAG: hypothetical protein AVDCRST_MAG45-79 [uncultured Solirubrobacterales bacterium]|uniref:Uncharacterized protein n=1 Tax=uncultured Solirubrobacterales bacterium TaxID=768556 RepID=A0A6J4RSD5_9ACTN|nr:MAG: hypothetical protein AVDCRST_MAG45-79 [uncultured Solirubrobacterales bacterium]